ncbi:nuclear protein [Murid herpesvirus 3]|uniref:Nuclear protein n=2 Tax=Murid betaherpesvirus 3 TaxID=2560603 RepID=A0A1P8VIV7_9BETA|nr:nuclear protein [Murine roseolovirus]APZ76278.1 nuclear protein [Murid betaherpesvirus 3]AYH64787.1 nuclear protein [Murid herpesvirus 3]
MSEQILNQLPIYRKYVGKCKHLKLYKNLIKYKDDFRQLNKFCGNILPEFLSQYEINIYFEVRLGHRIPDIILVFSKEGMDTYCYITEIKTTFSKVNKQTVKTNRVQNIQYLQGLKQLQQSAYYLKQFNIANGERWLVFPVILFFKQDNLKLNFYKCFQEKIYTVSTEFIKQLFKNNQDAKVCALFSKRNRTHIRKSQKKHVSVYKRRSK